jgi:hypothetical protein
MNPEQVLRAAAQFRGDIDVYEDGSAQLRPYRDDLPVVWGRDLPTALERWAKVKK